MTIAHEAALLPAVTRRHAVERPDAPAVVADDGVWSWADLDRRADAIAARLAGLAGGPESRVGLAIGATANGIAALHGAARADVTAILVNPRLTAMEIGALLEVAGAGGLAIDPATGVRAPAGIEAVRLDVDGGQGADGGPSRSGDPGRSRDRGRSGSPSVFVVPTSGTTARPKLARLPLDRLAASAAAWAEILPPSTGWLLSLGLAHVAGLGIVVRAAAAGVAVVVPDGTDAAAFLAAIDRAGRHGVVVSHASLVATQLAGILDATGDGPPPDGLRAVILGGGPIPEALVRRALAAGWPVIPSYGLTESASGVVASGLGRVAEAPGTVGVPLPGVELRFDDGEILVRGPMVFNGYLDDPAATAAALTADGWLRTGDLGRLDEAGRIVVEGRRDDAIISGGENVSPAEVEAVLSAHPAIREVAVIGVPDPTWGQVPVAIVVIESDRAATDAELRDFARDRIARFKVPARFVRVAALPRTSLGKVARPELRRLAEAAESPVARPAEAPTAGSRGAATAPRPTAATPAEATNRTVTADDGQAIAVRQLPSATADPDAPVVVLLHATLSTSGQLMPLARRLSEGARVFLIDRRGSGDSHMASPGPVPVARHVADVLAVLDAVAAPAATIVGHSFGGVVALETTARHPERVASILAWEPPYLALADPPVRSAMSAVAGDVAAAFSTGGSGAAAHRFLDAVAGAGAWDRLHARQRASIGREGTGALADAAMDGLEPDGLGRIACPVIIATGDASEPFYAPIADALAARIGANAVRVHLPGLRHPAPITDPVPIADLARRLFAPEDDPATEPCPRPALVPDPDPAAQETAS